MTTRKRTTKATQPKATETKAEEQAQELPPSVETRPDDSAPGAQIDGQGLEPVQGEATQKGDNSNTPPQDTGLHGDIPALFVRTKRRFKSRRRAGFRFSREGYGIALSALTEDQIKAIVSDPALEVESCTFPGEPGEDPEASR